MKQRTQNLVSLVAILLIICISIIGLTSLARFRRTSSLQSIKVGTEAKVIASFYPLYYFASQIASPHLSVENITPYGNEPHEYEPTYQQLADLESTQLLLLNGNGFEPWAVRLTPQLEAKNVLVIATTETISGANIDPHVWLSPKLAQIQVKTITEALIQIDPNNKTSYENQSSELVQELQTLDTEFTQGLRNCQQKTFVTSHAAFGHLAEQYNLQQLSISGISPEEEPSSRTLAELSALIKENKVKYVFFETLVSPKLAQTLAAETGAQTLVLDPLEGLSQNQIESGENYFTVMKSNLTQLRLALQCQ